MQKKISVVGANKLYFSVLVIFLAFSFVAEVIGAIMQKDMANDYFHSIILITEFVLILTPVIIYAAKNKLNFKKVFRLNKLGVIPAAFILLIAIPALYVSIMLNSLAIYILQHIGYISANQIPAPQSMVQLVIGILVIGVSPAICEEALHRGVLLSAYEKRGSIKAVVISAIMFGFFHFDILNLLSPIFLGILIGYYVLRTNSIFAGVFAHFIHNSISEIIDYMNRNEPVPSRITISGSELGQIVLFGITSLVIVFVLLRVFKKVTEDTSSYHPPIASIKNDVKSILSHWPIIVSLVLYFFTAAITVLVMFLRKLAG